MMNFAVVLDSVTKCYGHGANTATVINAVSLSVPAGEFVSIMGPSGSGKSTLLNLIAGLDTPTTGSIVVEGQDMTSIPDDERSDLRLRRIGFVFQSFNLFPTFTIEENVMWPLEFSGVGTRDALTRARAVLDQVELSPAAYGRRPSELSGGEQQRAAIARALVGGPTLILADEPTGNLDSRTGQRVLDLLRRLNREVPLTVILVTHSALAATYGDRTVELRDGRIIRDVRPPADASGRVLPLRE
ncbi:MAG TPA: ABC transporter ATP-binding protein [Candidatus Eisenbacteria bacterium]|nr:ABC transporter ATP-binding protein [Candidatus Eisenbacteria bacterium]